MDFCAIRRNFRSRYNRIAKPTISSTPSDTPTPTPIAIVRCDEDEAAEPEFGLWSEPDGTEELLLGVAPILFEGVVAFDCRLSGNTIG